MASLKSVVIPKDLKDKFIQLRNGGASYKEIAAFAQKEDNSQNWYATKVWDVLNAGKKRNVVTRDRKSKSQPQKMMTQPNDRVALADLFWSTLSANQKINIVRKFL